MSNRLKYETSPYLLQHAENPVDWYPWCEEAFQRAAKEDKPIFLSIGYSTCHWCHVMAHESFEDEKIAAILNRDFISIKVDKEERPDIDSVYMTVCQAFTGSGGWPTSIFMTADQKPFFAGTYFPKSGGRGFGFYELLTAIKEKWDTSREELTQGTENIIEQLMSRSNSGRASRETFDTAIKFYSQSYDAKNGGFGHAPKFPSPHNLIFLMKYYERFGNTACLEMAEKTLLQMYRGGLFDHIGFGFCRYSTDNKFLAPHFEKMLYDNALMILAYCKAYRCTKKDIYLNIAQRTADFILNEMTSPDGGFYSAQDADSEGEEGKYYLFVPEEIIRLFGEKDGNAFNKHFDISRKGNFEGKNIPNLLYSDYSDTSFDKFLTKIASYRKDRYPLHTDDKILTSWNSLVIAAMCELYRASKKSVYLDAAKKADKFIESKLSDGDVLYVSFRKGKRGVEGFLDDYAGYIFAKLSLYAATLNEKYINQACFLLKKVLSDFADTKDGGFYLYGNGGEKLILRQKETYDGAMPSGNSLMAYNLVRISQLVQSEEYERLAVRQLDFMAADATQYPPGYAMFLASLLDYYEPPVKAVVVMPTEEEKKTLPFILPYDTVIAILAEPNESFPLKDGRTTYYVCKNHSCMPAVNSIDELHL